MAKAKIAFAYGVIFLIPLLGLWELHCVRQCCDKTAEYIDMAISRADTPASGDATDKAFEVWLSYEELLTSFVTHEKVDAVTAALSCAKAFFESGGGEEYLASLYEARMLVNIVRNFDKPTVRSVF